MADFYEQIKKQGTDNITSGIKKFNEEQRKKRAENAKKTTPNSTVQTPKRDTVPSSPSVVKTPAPGTVSWQNGKAYYTDTGMYPRQKRVYTPMDFTELAVKNAVDKIMEQKALPKQLDFTNYNITSPFGKNNGIKSAHNGIDYATPMNTPVGAVANGTVIQTGNAGTYGNLVKVRFDDGNIGYYSHLNSFNVKAGDKVRAGDILGTSGNTGRSTGPHLHLEVRGADDNYYNQIDPQKYIDMYNPQPYKAPEPLYYDFKTGGLKPKEELLSAKPSRQTSVEIPISDNKTISLKYGTVENINDVFENMSSESVKERNANAKGKALFDYLNSKQYNDKVGSDIMNGKLITPESLRYKLPIDVTKDVGNEKRPNSTKRAEVLKSEIEKMGLQGEELKNALDYAKAINPTVGGDIGYAAKSFLAGVSSGLGGAVEGMITAPLTKEIEKGANGLSKAERFKEIAADYMVRNLFPNMKPILNAYKTVSTSIRSLSKMYYTEERAKENGFKNVKEFVRSDIEKMYGKTDFFDKPANELAFKSIGVSDGAKFIGEISQVVGNMIPSIIASVATKNPEVGLGIMARSTMGQSANEALKNGATAEQAYYNGLLKGATEYLTEKMFGGIPLLGKGLFGSKADDLIAKLGESSIGKFLKSTYGKAVLELLERGGEGLEEAVSGLASGYIDRLTYDDNAELATAKEIGRDAFLGILVSFVMNAPVDVVKGISNIKSNATKTVESYPADVKEITPAENTEAVEDVSEILIAEDVDPNKQIEEELYKMIENGNISSAIAEQIVSDTELRSAFERLANVSVEGSKAEKRNVVKNWVNNSQNIENLKLSRAGLTSDHARVVSLLENPNSGNVRNIIKIPKLAQAFQELTGVDLEGDLDAQRNLVKENAEQAILNYNKAYETGKPLQINTNDEILTKVEGDNRKAETENIEAELTPPPSEPSQTATPSALPKSEPLTPSSDKSDNISKLMKGERVNIKDMSADEISRLEKEYGFKIKKQKQLDNIADRKALELRLKQGEQKLDEEVFGNDENAGLINDNSGDIIEEKARYSTGEENENGRRNLLLYGSGKRQYSKSTQKQASGLDKGSRRYSESGKRKRERIQYISDLKNKGKTVKASIEGHQCEAVSEADYTPEMKQLIEKNKKNGIDKTIIAAGAIRIPDAVDSKGNPKTARGMYIRKDGKKTVVVQWDNNKFSPEQINDHENIHDKYETRIVQDIKNSIFDKLTVSEKETIFAKVERDYRGIIDEDDKNRIEEEFVADVLSGMNQYAFDERFSEIAKAYYNKDFETINLFSAGTYSQDSDSGGIEQENTNKQSSSRGELSKSEWSEFYNSLYELERGKWFPQTSNGEYIFETYDKLIFTNGDYKNPKVNTVIVFDGLATQEIEYGKEIIWNVAQTGTSCEECCEIAQAMLGNGIITPTNPYFSKANGRSKNYKGKGKYSIETDKKIATNEDKITYSTSSPSESAIVEEDFFDDAGIVEEKTADVLLRMPEPPKENLKARVEAIVDYATRKIFDSGNAFAKIGKIVKDDTLYAYYDLAKRGKTSAMYCIEKAQKDINGKTVGKSLVEIFQPVIEKGEEYHKEFSEYLFHKHNVDRMKYDKPVFGWKVTSEMSEEKANELLMKHPEFLGLAEEVYKYVDNELKYAADSGLVSQSYYKSIREKYPHYVPTYRDYEAPKGKGKKGKLSEFMVTAEGGTENLLPILQTLTQKTIKGRNQGQINVLLNRVLAHAVNNKQKMSQFVTRITSLEAGKNDINAFTFYRNGKAVTLHVNDSLNEGIKSLVQDYQESNAVIDAITNLNNAYKASITSWSPMFTIKNFARDIQDTLFYSKDSAAFAKAYPKAWKEMTTGGEMWELYCYLGGFDSGILDTKTGLPIKPKGISKIGDAVQYANYIVEQSPRFAEFLATVENGGTSRDNLAQAMLNSANVTVNFNRSGTVTKVLNKSFVPFLNPSIQGMSNNIRILRESKDFKAWGALIIKATLFGVMPTVINNLMYDDDEDYQNLYQRDKDTNYIFKLPNGQFLKIPKGRLLAAMGATTNFITNLASGNEADVDEYLSLMYDNLGPVNPLTSNIAAPIILAKMNRTWYGGEIESQRMEGLFPEEKYDSSTSSIAKGIGKALKISPMKIDYVLDAYSGVFGDFILPWTSDKGASNPAEAFKRAFVIDPVYSNKISADYYSKKDYWTNMKNSVRNDKRPVAAVVSRYLNSCSEAISNLNNQIRETEASKIDDKFDKLKEVRVIKNATLKTMTLQLSDVVKSAHKLYSEADLKQYIAKYGKDGEQKYIDYLYREMNKKTFGAEYALQIYNKDTYKKAQKVYKEGVSYDSFYNCYFGFKELGENATNDDKRAWLMDSKEFSSGEKAILDKNLISRYSMIYNDRSVDYSNEESFILTQMSDAAQRKKSRFPNMSAERYNKLYEAYSSGQKKADKIKNLVEAGMTYTAAEQFYKTISKK